MSNLFIEFLFAFLGTLGFALIFNVPLRHIPIASLIGGAGWVVYHIAVSMGSGVAIACFLGACTVGLTSDIASRLLKEAATIFVIPGVLPLVPGAGTYYTMLAIIQGNLDQAAAKGIETLAMAGAIALGLLLMGTIIQIIRGIARRIKAA